VRLTSDECWSRVRGADHGILVTQGARQSIDAVPVCFTVVATSIVTPVDRVKAKSTTELGRLKNLDRDGAATLLCEHWDPHDWSQLWWVRVRLVRRPGHDVGDARREESARSLRQKYPQYSDADFAEILHFDVKSLVGWSA
jgi:hypothetical protein